VAESSPLHAAAQRDGRPPSRRRLRWLTLVVAVFVVVFGATLAAASSVATAPVQASPPVMPTPPSVPEPITADVPTPTSSSSTETDTATEDEADASIDVSFPKVTEDTSNSVVIILLLTVLSIAPSLLVLCTSFTRIVIVLSLTRNALGIPSIPPQQVIVGLSVFLTLFVMGPTLSEMKSVALDPLLAGEITSSEAFDAAQVPLREFLLAHTREDELELFLDASDTPTPVARDEVPLTAVIPAFVLSELKSGFIIGFVIFVPFLIIDLVVSAVLMGLGMMMLPPSFVSLPFKLLLFVMLDGWMLVVGTLLTSYG
jgi:flagellar biosynthetic protein FliP